MEKFRFEVRESQKKKIDLRVLEDGNTQIVVWDYHKGAETLTIDADIHHFKAMVDTLLEDYKREFSRYLKDVNHE